MKRHVRDFEWLKARVSIDPKTGCWIWQLTTNEFGYGTFGITVDGQKHRTRRAHQLAYELRSGSSIPDGMTVRHICDTPPCCNPDHLELGPQSENVLDMLRRNRCSWRKLTDEDNLEILRRLEAGATGKALAHEFGVHPGTISRIKKRDRWHLRQLAI